MGRIFYPRRKNGRGPNSSNYFIIMRPTLSYYIIYIIKLDVTFQNEKFEMKKVFLWLAGLFRRNPFLNPFVQPGRRAAEWKFIGGVKIFIFWSEKNFRVSFCLIDRKKMSKFQIFSSFTSFFFAFFIFFGIATKFFVSAGKNLSNSLFQISKFFISKMKILNFKKICEF